MARKKKTSTSSEKSWRDLQQDIGSSPMTDLARKKYWSIILRNGLVVALLILFAGGTYLGSVYYMKNRESLRLELPSAKLAEVLYDTNGVLDGSWLGRNLRLPNDVMMRDVDVVDLRRQLLRDPQVKEVVVKKVFPDVLDIELREYVPIARIRLMVDHGMARDFLVAEDGYAYSGYGYPSEQVDELPYLQNFSLEERVKKTYVLGMPVVSDLLRACQTRLPRSYKTWRTIDLSSFDGRPDKPWNFIKVYSDEVDLLVFGASDFHRQLDRLGKILHEIDSDENVKIASLNLSLTEDIVATFSSPMRRL